MTDRLAEIREWAWYANLAGSFAGEAVRDLLAELDAAQARLAAALRDAGSESRRAQRAEVAHREAKARLAAALRDAGSESRRAQRAEVAHREAKARLASCEQERDYQVGAATKAVTRAMQAEARLAACEALRISYPATPVDCFISELRDELAAEELTRQRFEDRVEQFRLEVGE